MPQLALSTPTPNPKDLHIGQRLRVLRTERKVSQTELGKGSKISFQQVQKYENGTNRISVSRLIEFAEFLGTPVNHFFVGLDNHVNVDEQPNAQEWLLLEYYRSTKPDAQLSILNIVKQTAQLSA